jgi:hypothetical protein
VCAGSALLTIIPCGCGSKYPQPTFPVSGVVLWSDGRPAPELALATVTLSGKNGDGPKLPVNPRAQVLVDGTFVLQTYEPDDGAPAGTYCASITTSPPSRDKDAPKTAMVMDPKFESHQTSGLEVTIKPERNQLQLTVQRAKH